MKKVISIILSVLLIASVTTVYAVPAFAKPVQSIESTTNKEKEPDIKGKVNGNPSNDVTWERDPKDPTKITFTYTGNGELVGWEFPGMVEGKDYKVISRDGNSITIQLLNGYSGEVVANAVVKDENGETTTSAAPQPNGNSKSPKTGATTATAVAVAGAGIAVLVAMKKKNED